MNTDISIESDSLKETLEQIQNSLIEIQAQIQSNTARLDKLDFNSPPRFVHYDPNGLPAAFRSQR